MKKMLDRGWMIILAFVMVTAMSITSTKAQTSVSLQVFYDELQPYGTWMDYGTYGYVWIPRVAHGFVPYATNGYWINTEYGNTWVSDYTWGWAPFHYGRWLLDDFYGWIWVPDTEWAPAWVTWRSGGGYYGWAPLMPGIHMHMAMHYYNRIPHHYWSFVPYRYVTYRNVYTHCASRPTVVNIYNNTTIVNHYYTDNRKRTYFTGPSRHDIERRGGGRVTMHHIDDTDRPSHTQVSRSSATFYRPDIDNSRSSRMRSMPAQYVRKDRSGNLENVETKGQRPGRESSTLERSNDFKRSNDLPKEPANSQREAIRDRSQQRKYETTRDFTPKDFPSQERVAEPRRETPSRTYERLPNERQRMTRDQYEAPPIDRTRDVQRRTNEQRQPQTERQPAVRQRETTINRDHSSVEPNRLRSSVRQQSEPSQRSSYEPSQRKSTRGSSTVQPEFRKRN